MIRSLDDASKWYVAVKTLALDMRKPASKWDDPALEAVLGHDYRLRDRTSAELVDSAKIILDNLEDLSVLVLFSVFEADVRSRAQADIDRETVLLRDPAVLRAVSDLKETIQNGSFGRVTEAYKDMDVDLTTQVNQVRKFRNWVAHGRRDEPENNVEPETAIHRLRRYIARLTESDGTSTIGPPSDEPLPEKAYEPAPTDRT